MLTAQWGEAGEPVSLIYDFNYATYGITAYNTKDTSETEDGLPNNSKVTVSDFADFGKEPDGYAFLGWNTKADGSGEMIDPGDFIWIDGVQPLPNRLYAIWEKTSVPPSDPTPEPPSDPTPTPEPESKPKSTPTPTPDYVVTCQMAGYPADYVWNENVKACVPGFRRTKVPNTYDKGLMGNFTVFLISDLLGIAAVLLLKKY